MYIQIRILKPVLLGGRRIGAGKAVRVTKAVGLSLIAREIAIPYVPAKQGRSKAVKSKGGSGEE